jgi:hypothetical protein
MGRAFGDPEEGAHQYSAGGSEKREWVKESDIVIMIPDRSLSSTDIQ